MVYGSTVQGAASARELEGTLQAFVATSEMDGSHGDGQLAKHLGDLGGQEGRRLGVWCLRLDKGEAGYSG